MNPRVQRDIALIFSIVGACGVSGLAIGFNPSRSIGNNRLSTRYFSYFFFYTGLTYVSLPLYSIDSSSVLSQVLMHLFQSSIFDYLAAAALAHGFLARYGYKHHMARNPWVYGLGAIALVVNFFWRDGLTALGMHFQDYPNTRLTVDTTLTMMAYALSLAVAWVQVHRHENHGPAQGKTELGIFLSLLAIVYLGALPFLPIAPLAQLSFAILGGHLSIAIFSMTVLTMLLGDLAEMHRKDAILDDLTGLWNRRHFREQCQLVMDQASRNPHELSLLLCDIDHFKQINDRYGHGVGDQVIEAFAMALKGALRSGDLSGRYGGEEFIALLPFASKRETADIAERIRDRLEKTKIPTSYGAIQITASFGVSRLDPGEYESAFIRADEALYRAKESGRNRVCVAET